MCRCRWLSGLILAAGTVSVLALVPAVPAEDPNADAQAAAAVPQEIPDAEKARPNPRPAVEPSIQNGRQIFASQCTMCHGTTGDGQGDLVERLAMTVPDFRTAGWQEQQTDGALYFVITNGHGRMRGEGKRFSDDTKWDLVNYIRSLGPSN